MGDPWGVATRTLRMRVEYDGAGFAGWAVQPGQRTCAGVLGDALCTLLRHEVHLRAAGRTDAGVHATGQVVSLTTGSDLDHGRMLRGLAGLLPADIAVREVGDAAPGFDARADAVCRAYEYRVLPGPPSPLRRTRALHHPHRLDRDALDAAAAVMVGRHDFTAFTPTDTQHVFFHRTLTRCEWVERGDELVLCVEGDAFLRHMVRVIVGTLLLAGRGRWSTERVAALLEGAPRSAAGATAPAHPLTLVRVDYPGSRAGEGPPEGRAILPGGE